MKKSLFIACLLFMSLVCIESVLGQAPTITNISPSNAPLGTDITITGSGFNASGPNDIFFGSVKVTVNADASGTEIIVKAPAGASSVAPVIVRNNVSGLQASTLQSTTPYFTVTRTVPLSVAATSYSRTSYNESFTTLENLGSGDFDNDGYADIIVGKGFSEIQLFRNNGLGGFSFTSFLPLTGGSGAFTIVPGDINADGNLDIVVGKTGTGDLDIFLGNGDLTFTTATSIPGVTGGSGGVVLEDLNNDGNLDIACNFFSTIHVLVGDGAGNFTEPVGSSKDISGITFNPINLAAADFDEDGFTDIVTAGGNPGLVLILINNGDNTFADPVTYATGNIPRFLLVGDYNADGNVDIAVLSFTDGNIATLSGDGLGGFTAFAGSPRAVTGAGLRFSQGDFDGDGIIDFALPGGATNTIPLLKGDGTGGFNSFPAFPFNVAPASPNRLLWDDFNNDGVADFAFTRFSSFFEVLLSPPSFRTTWITTDGEITIPTQGTGYNYDVFWNNLTNPGVGDGVVTGQTGNYTITGLANDDTYQIRIRGDFPRIYFNNGTEKDKIRTIEEWGDIAWGPILTDSFYGCSNLTSNATDVPDLSNVTNMTTFFRNATSFNSDISQWDLSNVNFMSGMFSGASAFNNGGVPLTWGGTVSNIVNMSGVFENATTFNQNINDWDVSSVQNMSQMFFAASNFNNANQPLTWSTNGGTANVNTMQNMFLNASSFNQDIGAWDVSSVTNMNAMLIGSGLSSANYEATLEGWASQTLQNSVQLDASGIIYCSPSAIAARAIIIDTYSWTINDGGVCQPTGQANSIDISNIASTQGLISWTNGNGSDRIVVMREGTAVNLDPSDLTTYTANTNFGSGSEIGTGNYVVYNGNGSSTTISALNPETTYHFRVYEYNGTAANENYLLSTAVGNPANTTTLASLSLVSNVPEINARNVDRASTITLDFDLDINLSSVHNASTASNEVYDDNIKIFGNQSGQVEGTFSVGAENSIILFTPSNDFKAGEKITVTITASVLGNGGENATKTSFSFIAATGPFAGLFKNLENNVLTGIGEGDVAWGDYDGDGDLDLAVAGWDPDYNDVAIIYNNVDGVLTDIGATLAGRFYAEISWVDYDNDGDLDLFMTGQTGPGGLTTLYRNDGGSFTEQATGITNVFRGGADWGDYDNDGDMDLLITGVENFGSSIYISKVYRNDGSGTFTELSTGFTGVEDGVATWVDYDNDGDLDIFVSGFDGSRTRRSFIHRNDRSDTFTDIGTSLPALVRGGADWADYDNDGDLDLIYSGEGIIASVLNRYTDIYRNDGGDTFTAVNAGITPTTESDVAWGDFDGDGDPDIAISGFGPVDYLTEIYRNDGGIFSEVETGLNGAIYAAIEWGDYDGDGDLDLLVTGEEDGSFLHTTRIISNVAPLNLVASAPTANETNILTNSNITLTFDAAVNQTSVDGGTVSDFTDDNILVVGSQSGYFNGTFSGNGTTTLTFNPDINFKAGEIITVTLTDQVRGTAGEVAIPSSFSFIAASAPFEGAFIERTSGILGMADGSFAWGDYDNDGDLDVIVVGYDPSFDTQATIYRNDNGTFTDIGAGLTGVFFSAAEWGDYDSDGDLDLVVAGLNATGTARLATIYRNNGDDTFTDIGAGLQGVDFPSLDWGDYDNDGDLDLIVMGRTSFSPAEATTTIYENNGGVFTDIDAGLQALNNGSADWGDYDGDGNLDLLLTGFDADWAVRYSIIYDNNDGVFTDLGAGLPGVGYGDAEWGDYDNDGDLDILLLGDGSSLTYTSIFNNDGGVFSDIGAGLPTTSEGSAKWGDFDGDGFLDILITGNDYSTSTEITNIYKNNGSTSFTDINARLETVYFVGLAEFIDYDGDGDLDLFVAGESSSTPSSTSAVLYENTTFPIYYSQGSGAFDTPALWNSAADGSGFSPIASNFTDGKTDFIIRSGDVISAAADAISINNFTIEDGGVYQNGAQDIVVFGLTNISGGFSDAVNAGSSTFFGSLIVESTGSFTTSGATSNTFNFHGDISNRGTFDLTSSVFWNIESDLTILNESSSAMNFSSLNSGIGSINANVIVADSPGGGNISLRSNDYIRMADNTTIRNELGDYPTNSRILEIAELRAISTSANFENAENAIVLIREGSAGTFDGIGFDFTATDNLVRYFSNGNVLAVDHYHMAVTAGATSLLLGTINIFGDLTIENGNVLEANGFDINIAGNWVNNEGSAGFTPGAATVTFNSLAVDPQEITGATTFNNLVIDNSGSAGEVILNSEVSIASDLTLTTGILNVTDGNMLSFSDLATVGGDFGSSQMIRLAPTALIRKYFDADGSFTYPIGTGNNYNETTITLNAGTVYDGAIGSRYVDLNLLGTEEPNVINTGLALNKYWTLNSVNLSNISASLALSYTDLDGISGEESSYLAGVFNGAWSTTSGVDAANNTITFAFSGISDLNANYTAGELVAFSQTPRIDSFTPQSAGQGTTVTLTGYNLTNASSISFGGTAPSSFIEVSSGTELTVVIGPGTSGNIEIVTPEGTSVIPGFTFINAPVVDSFSPATAAQGATVTLTGTDFTGATTVSFGGIPATSFTVISDTEISAVVGNGSSGNIEVTTPGGTVSIANFTFINAPVVDSFSPATAAQGETVTLIGTDFTDATAVSFGGTPASSFTVVSDTEITALVANGSSGNIEVTTPGGTVSIANFTFINAPVVDSFSPAIAAQGETVILIGTDFTDATAVSFGGTPATSFTVVSDTEITAVVGNGATGNIQVETPGGSITLAGFTFIQAPSIASFSPASVGEGTMVTIIGTNFSNATAVSFGGTNAASFTVISDTEITAVVGNGATGNIFVTTPGGTISLAGFTFIPAPSIVSFSPTSVAEGETVTIIGSNFSNATAVSFGGTDANSFTVVSDTEISAVVGNGATGNIEVTTPGGTFAIAGFEFISEPFITSFSPTSAAQGETVTIIGSNFTSATAVSFGGTDASSFTLVSANEITAVVAGGASGEVSVTTPSGTANLEGFTFLSPEIAVYLADNTTIINNQSEVFDFGTTFPDETIERQVRIENTGTTDLLISNISSSDPAFEILDIPNVINPGSSNTVTLQFNSNDLGIYNSEIILSNNSANAPEFIFEISAEIIDFNIIDNETEAIIISNDDIDLGETFINVNVDKNFKIENLSSNSTIQILSITVDNPVFQIIGIPTTITPSSSAEFTVRLNASAVGEYRGIVTVVTNLNEFSFQVVGEVLPEASTEIKVFNVITPNGDGRHDLLQIENITEYSNNVVSIFNRWGNKVFEITGYNNTDRVFEGISDNGQELLTGNYYYVIDKGNGEKRISGFLIIKR